MFVEKQPSFTDPKQGYHSPAAGERNAKVVEISFLSKPMAIIILIRRFLDTVLNIS